MERYLRSLLASLDGVEQTVNKGSLSRLAQTFLTGEGSDDPGWVRAKAGLLALLNLMGILEVFYAAGELAEIPAVSEGGEEEGQVSTGSSAPETGPEAPTGGPVLPQGHPIADTILQPARREGSLQPQSEPSGLADTHSGAARPDALAPLLSAIPLLLGSKEGGGIDPTLISAILKLVSSLSRSKPASATEDGSFSGDEPCETYSETPGDSPGDATRTSSQGSLGPDPNLIASLLNFLAGLDKSEQKTGRSTNGRPPPEVAEKDDQKVEITLSPDGKSVIARSSPRITPQAPSLSEFLRQPSQCAKTPVQPPADRHKPGVGIRRGWIKQRRLGNSKETDYTQHVNKSVFARNR